MHQKITRRGALLLAVALLAAVVSGCGGSTKSSSTGSNQTDQGFVNDMTPHHTSAISMAKIALTRAQHPEIRSLAKDIVSAQKSEIALMAGFRKQFAKSGADGHETLAMDSAAMGMNMDAGMLKTAKPFDRQFIDMMVPHHQGAIAMAKVELAKGTNTKTKALADGIVAAQTKEISEMNQWRTKWYGGPVPESRGHSMSMSG